MVCTYLEHTHEGVARVSEVLSWQSVLVPVRPSVIHGANESAGIGISTIAIVALLNAAGKFFTPLPVLVDEKCRIIFSDEESTK